VAPEPSSQPLPCKLFVRYVRRRLSFVVENMRSPMSLVVENMSLLSPTRWMTGGGPCRPPSQVEAMRWPLSQRIFIVLGMWITINSAPMTDLRPVGQSVKVCVGCAGWVRVRLREDRRAGRGLQRDVVYLGWAIAPSYMIPNAGGGGVAGSYGS
jgi:hypothetical protein